MLKVSDISKSFGARVVLDGVSFVVNDGERAGVVGPNGSGKTTLLNIIAGDLPSDAGSVDGPPGARIAYLRQGTAGIASMAASEAFPGAFASRGDTTLGELAQRLAAETDATRAADIERDYEATLGHVAAGTNEARALWRALALRDIAPYELVGSLSGGEQTKLGLIDVAASHPDVLLLDEPTNNLDLDALGWLDEYLDSFAGAVLLVSHDRALLDDHASEILEIDPSMGRLEVFPGDYTSYAGEKARRRDELWARYRRQQRHERHVWREIGAIKSTAQRREGISQNDYYRRRNKKFMRRAVVLERRLRRELDSAEHVDKPRVAYGVKAEFETGGRGGDRMVAASRLSVSAGGRALLTDVEFAVGWGERVVLLGPNGSGKTTFLRALLGTHSADAGTVRLSPSARPGYLPQSDPGTGEPEAGTPLEIVRRAAVLSETDARRFLHRFLFSSDDALRPVARLSYGERRRLALARVILAGANLLLLDEPTNHLDIPSREAFESALESYEGAMIVVTHDRFFIDRFAQRLLTIKDRRLVDVMRAGD